MAKSTKAAKKGFNPAPPGFAETQSLTLLPRPEGARDDYEAVLMHLAARDQERLERESAERVAELAAKRQYDRFHPEVIFAKLAADEAERAGITRQHGSEEQEERLRVEEAKRRAVRVGALVCNIAAIPKLKPQPAYDPPEYFPLGRDEPYPDAWEANIP